MAVHRQLEFALSESSKLLQQLQLSLQVGRSLWIGDNFIDWLLVSKDSVLALDRLPVKLQRSTSAHCQDNQEKPHDYYPLSAKVLFPFHEPEELTMDRREWHGFEKGN
jgi:hypothetical protein